MLVSRPVLLLTVAAAVAHDVAAGASTKVPPGLETTLVRTFQLEFDGRGAHRGIHGGSARVCECASITFLKLFVEKKNKKSYHAYPVPRLWRQTGTNCRTMIAPFPPHRAAVDGTPEPKRLRVIHFHPGEVHKHPHYLYLYSSSVHDATQEQCRAKTGYNMCGIRIDHSRYKAYSDRELGKNLRRMQKDMQRAIDKVKGLGGQYHTLVVPAGGLQSAVANMRAVAPHTKHALDDLIMAAREQLAGREGPYWAPTACSIAQNKDADVVLLKLIERMRQNLPRALAELQSSTFIDSKWNWWIWPCEREDPAETGYDPSRLLTRVTIETAQLLLHVAPRIWKSILLLLCDRVTQTHGPDSETVHLESVVCVVDWARVSCFIRLFKSVDGAPDWLSRRVLPCMEDSLRTRRPPWRTMALTNETWYCEDGA